MSNNPPKDKLTNFEKWKLAIGTLKWVIGSGALVWATWIIDNGFKERTAGIQEMQAFDKYVEVILKADNIDARWRLAQFFSTVTPTDRLRERWVAYKNLIEPDYNKFISLKKQQDSLRQQFVEGKQHDAFVKLNKVTNQLVPFEKRLNGSTPQSGNVDLEAPLKNFKDQVKKDSSTDRRYLLDDYFKKTNDLNNSVVYDLVRDLGEPYQSIQTGIDYNYKEATFSNQFGIQSKFDNSKKIWPTLQAKFVGPNAIFTLKENGVTESFRTPISDIDWNEVKQFVRKYYIDRLNLLR
jgi:hypothetical protein